MKKLIFLLVLPVVLSFQQDRARTTTFIKGEHLEILNGKVKQLTENYVAHIGNWETDITGFDIEGNMIQTRKTDGGRDYVIKYDYKYDKNNSKEEVVDNFGMIYKYDENGDISSFILKPGDTNSASYLFKYDTSRNVIECDNYFSPKVLMDITYYSYDKKHLLLEVNAFSGKGDLTYNAIYEYKSFDDKNNWIKRVRRSKNIYDQWHVRIDTTYRKITYY